MCLPKTLFFKISYHVLYTISDVYINMLSVRRCWIVWQFTMTYPIFIILNDLLMYEMWSYVIDWQSSPLPTFSTGTKIFSIHNWCISFSKFQELFNPILILVIDAWCFHPTSIHVSRLLWHFIKLSIMNENLTFFSLKVWPYPIQEDIFIVDSNV